MSSLIENDDLLFDSEPYVCKYNREKPKNNHQNLHFRFEKLYYLLKNGRQFEEQDEQISLSEKNHVR